MQAQKRLISFAKASHIMKIKRRRGVNTHTKLWKYGNMLLVCCQLLLKLNEKKNKHTNSKMIKRFVTLMLYKVKRKKIDKKTHEKWLLYFVAHGLLKFKEN